jgi:hydrogenase/urease accessory protein HupE
MKIGIRLTFVVLLGMAFKFGIAHEIRPAYLQLQEVAENEYTVLWKVPRTADKVLDIQPRFENDFTLNMSSTPKVLEAFMLYAYTVTGNRSLTNTKLSIQNLEETGIDVLVDIRLLDGQHHTFLLHPTTNTLVIPDKPNKWHVAKTYTILGIEHILLGFDHLLFVFALLIISVGFKKLLKTITAFTVAHSITLSFSALGLAKLPGPPVEAVIALSIVFLALEIFKIQHGKPSLTSQKPWLVAFSFGLLHGFGFAGALAAIGLPQNEIPLALATFNIGVELGQLMFVFAVLLVWRVINGIIPRQGWITKIAPYAIGSMAAFWMIDRIVAF